MLAERHIYVLLNCRLLLTTYSKTKVSEDLVWMMSCSVTMLVCFNSLRSDASRMAVKGAPSSSCRRISFRATTWFVRLKEVRSAMMSRIALSNLWVNAYRFRQNFDSKAA